MADVKISALGAIGSVAGEDLVAIVDDPSGTPASRKATITQIATFINASAVTAGSTTTFTAKSIDVDNNTITNIEVDNLKSGVLDTDITSVSASDDTIPSAKAVKTYVDAQIATEDTLSELNDTTITSVGDNELLQYNSTSSVWENQTLAEADIATATNLALKSPLSSPTFTGTVTTASLDVAGNNIDNVQNVIHDISATGLDIDFSEDQLQTYPTLTGNVTFTTFQNIVAGKSKTIRLLADGSDRTCTFPSGIKWVGTAPTSNVHTVTASKYAIITFTSFGTTEAEIIGAFAVEE